MATVILDPLTTKNFEEALDRLHSTLDLPSMGYSTRHPGMDTGLPGCDVKVSPPPYSHVNKPVNVKFRKRDNDILADIKQVIYNDPATIVTFSDGTKVCVKAANGDKFSKELGIVYAIVKRLYANDTDRNFYLRAKGLGDKITKLVKGATDQKEIEKKRQEAKAKAKAKAKKKAEADEAMPADEATPR